MANVRDALWESGYDESVEVNQRALIDKVLARYSGEFTVFRELLQNSDDASASAVEIHFETKAYLDRENNKAETGEASDLVPEAESFPDLKNAAVHQWTFKNNGIVFRDEDWSRLKKIAEGNPDEEKIGAFGVGFYSLFSVTEEPWVFSGGQWMNFYWKDKKDQLFARRGVRKGIENDPWTTFQMELREPTPIPQPFDFTRFLASSITFMRHLVDVSIFLDDKRLSRLTKNPGKPVSLALPKGLKPSSPLGTMTVHGIMTTPLSIKAEVMEWVYMAGTEKPQPKKEVPKPTSGGGGGFFSSLFSSFGGSGAPSRSITPTPTPSVPKVDPKAIVESNVVLSIFTADIAVSLDQKMVTELNRSTKKNPPTRMKYELIYTGKKEYDASKSEDTKHGRPTGSIFQGLRADIDGTGQAKVFIGHSTAQTTGLAGHMSARFIPTVERESIDLVDRNVAVWNKELLYMGGYLSRAAYEIQISAVQHTWDTALAAAKVNSPDATLDEELRVSLRDQVIHALKFFTFHASTPSSVVSRFLEEAFFACAVTKTLFSGRKTHFYIMSSTGVRDAFDVRYPDEAFDGFMKNLPIVPKEVLDQASAIIDKLREQGMLKDINFKDVLEELRDRPLTLTEMQECFKWWIKLYNRGMAGVTVSLDTVRSQLLNAAVLTIEEAGKPGQIVPLSIIESFLNSRTSGSLIPTDGPLPPHLLPVSLSRHFDPAHLMAAFGWRELSITEWLKHIHDVHLSPQWAERVLNVLARASPSLSKGRLEETKALLSEHACIPTSAGLKRPSEAYFQNAHVFSDLPVLTLPSGAVVKGPMEKFLQTIGVRKHVDLQIVFDRMIKTGDWTIADLIKYLVDVQMTLTATELERLEMTSAFPRELREGEKLPENGKPFRQKASDLYEPLDVFRELKLPIIDWGKTQKWRSNSPEAKFLYKLGLRRNPPLPELIGLAANDNEPVRKAAMKYFFDHYATHYADYDPNNFSNVAFIPAVQGGKSCVARPHEVFSSPEWATLGFMVIDPSLKGESLVHLRLQEHPPGTKLVNLLHSSPPSSEEIGGRWFSILASRVSSFSSHELRALSQMAFVPVKRPNGSIQRLPPTQCYFKGDSQAQFHSKLFTFVDFGVTANAFLSACGVKHEPSVEEIAKILLDNPRQFYELAEGRENYLTELRNIAVNRRLISSGTLARLKRSPVLLCSQRIRKAKSPTIQKSPMQTMEELEEEDWEYQYDLATPDKIVIADDTHAYQLFGDVIFTAPQEDLLEEFYMELGCRRVSSTVREDYNTSGEVVGSRKAAETRGLILERLPLFLHEHTHTKTKVSYSWLNSDKNFIVKTFGKLTVTKTLDYREKKFSKSQDASAVARRINRGPIELWLAGNDQVDMYEVSTSMCRHLFDSPKVNDALLFMTILSTDLRALRRRGYNVDRILRQQKADRLAAEEARAKAKAAIASQTALNAPVDTLVSPPPLPAKDTLIDHEVASLPDESKHAGPMNTFRQSLQKMNQWKRKGDDNSAVAGPSDAPAMPPPVGNELQAPLLPPPRQDRARTPNPAATPRSAINSNIDLAIRACKEERNDTLRNRQHVQMVKESLNEGYCDVSGHPTDMALAGEMGGIKVFVAKDVPDMKSFMKTKSESLARFIYTIRPLQEVYTLPPTSLHIFYDRAGELIAFNRSASLFLNLRYFEQWHDAEVQAGILMNAYISWYFTLAHEIAHNLVKEHNSEHEFYFSSICEQYLPSFMKLVSGGGR
ncbi:uncharacterized protein BXZ73DRAFT_86493 [Epithele typhae]|uniref:uncharacterized protein n=1 Tax=Epithele typhae TaxID=378194 RepID=UPI002007717D|nr:uncharacterized protein BXZ73DRAFT_86493 [Epithele typhae]KAH9946348.1 hypothetical protein BXZ73DRAFT_86493 [Epithele typhae]